MIIHKDINTETLIFKGKIMQKGRKARFDVQDMFVLKHQGNLLSQLC